jgi:hypothetical protein
MFTQTQGSLLLVPPNEKTKLESGDDLATFNAPYLIKNLNELFLNRIRK